jgi:glycosyltransferase involved in cell wall biosynthesis
MNNPLISIITVSFNSRKTICDTIESVLNQTYQNIEYIIIDGASKDGTIELVQSYGNKISKFISEPDHGLYDAISKGINLATGNIIGVLNSDDYFTNNTIVEKIVSSFENNEIDAVFGDIQFVHPHELSKIVRYYSSSRFSVEKFKYGFMPAHPSFYVKKEFYIKLGLYKTDYKIAGDYELLIRFLYSNKLNYKYLGFPFVTMRTGGVSNQSLVSILTLNKEIKRACSENGIKTNYLKIYSKYARKIVEYFGNN